MLINWTLGSALAGGGGLTEYWYARPQHFDRTRSAAALQFCLVHPSREDDASQTERGLTVTFPWVALGVEDGDGGSGSGSGKLE